MSKLSRLILALSFILAILAIPAPNAGATESFGATRWNQMQFFNSWINPGNGTDDYRAALFSNSSMYRSGHPNDTIVNYMSDCIGTQYTCEVEVGLQLTYGGGYEYYVYSQAGVGGLDCNQFAGSYPIMWNGVGWPIECAGAASIVMGLGWPDTVELRWNGQAAGWGAYITDHNGVQLYLADVPVYVSNNTGWSSEVDEVWSRAELYDPLYKMDEYIGYPEYWFPLQNTWESLPMTPAYGQDNMMFSGSINNQPDDCWAPYVAWKWNNYYGRFLWEYGPNYLVNGAYPPPDNINRFCSSNNTW